MIAGGLGGFLLVSLLFLKQNRGSTHPVLTALVLSCSKLFHKMPDQHCTPHLPWMLGHKKHLLPDFFWIYYFQNLPPLPISYRIPMERIWILYLAIPSLHHRILGWYNSTAMATEDTLTKPLVIRQAIFVKDTPNHCGFCCKCGVFVGDHRILCFLLR